ncbi:MAG: cation:proton antiporter [Gemmatimonadales bacterium]
MPVHSLGILQALAVILPVAALVTVVFRRVGLPVVAGYLVAGIVVGSNLGERLISEPESVRTLAEMGVVLLMTTIGLEFRISKLLRLGPRVGLTAMVEVGAMLALGLMAGRMLGWSPLDALLAAGIVAISSTMVIAKIFEERAPDWRVRDLVFGVLVMEDLVAIALIAVCTTVAFGGDLSAGAVLSVLGRLGVVLAVLLAVGLLLVPPLMRSIVRRQRKETVLLTATGLAFLAAVVTQVAGFSVALGAFVAGMLMAESGVGHQVEEMIRPVKDLFAAVFFVAVGMLLDVAGAIEAWPVVLLFTGIVVIGKMVGVSAGAFLNGFGVRTAIRGGMSMAQIGEFSFIIAGLGVTSATSSAPLYPVAVATALLTAFLTPWLAGRSEQVACWIDAKLPKPLQTVATLYGSWVETLFERRSPTPSSVGRRVFRLLVLDALVLAAVVVGTSLGYRYAPVWLARFGVAAGWERWAVLALGVLAALPFGFGLALAIRRLARILAERAVPAVAPGKVDQGRAPRQVLLVTLEIALTVATALPLIAIASPFLPPYGLPAVVVAVLAMLGVSFWRTARDLDSHVRAGAELVAHVLARQGARADAESFSVVRDMLPGMGTVVPLRVRAESPAVGRTLGELNVRGLTGATIVALTRGDDRKTFPDARERIGEGDLIAVTGTHEAIRRAAVLMGGHSVGAEPAETVE